ncbi:hypothetical protein ACED16_19195 [Enterobacter hormaechei]
MVISTISGHSVLIKKMQRDFSTAKFDKLSRGKQIFEFCVGVKRKVFFIEEGDFMVRRKKDNKIITIITAPFVIGLVPAEESLPLYLEKIDHGKISFIEYTHFWSLVNYRDLLSEVMNVVSGYHTEILGYLELHTSCTETYTKNMIERWNKYPLHIRKRFSLLYFLVNSSYLSKSTLCRILKRFKEAGLLQLERGKMEMYEA